GAVGARRSAPPPGAALGPGRGAGAAGGGRRMAESRLGAALGGGGGGLCAGAGRGPEPAHHLAGRAAGGGPLGRGVSAAGWPGAGGRAARGPQTGPAFAAAVALTLAVTLLILPLIVGYNSIILWPALLLLVAHAPRAWREGGRGLRYAYLLLGLATGWYWL